MVKAADLGYISKNLENVPSKEEEKERRLQRAMENLLSTEPPDRLSPTALPNSLTGMGD